MNLLSKFSFRFTGFLQILKKNINGVWELLSILRYSLVAIEITYLSLHCSKLLAKKTQAVWYSKIDQDKDFFPCLALSLTASRRVMNNQEVNGSVQISNSIAKIILVIGMGKQSQKFLWLSLSFFLPVF